MHPRHNEAIMLAKQGNWDAAHEIVQNLDDPLACQIHGFLHRVEGDDSNASYWYRRAGVSFPKISIDEELVQICNSAGFDG